RTRPTETRDPEHPPGWRVGLAAPLEKARATGELSARLMPVRNRETWAHANGVHGNEAARVAGGPDRETGRAPCRSRHSSTVRPLIPRRRASWASHMRWRG